MRVQLSDGQLSFVHNNIFTRLTHWHYDTFSGAKDQVEDPVFKGVKFTFQTDSGGNIVALSVPMEQKVDDIVFKRKTDEQLSSPAFLKSWQALIKSEKMTVDVFVQGNHLSVLVPGQP